MRIAHLLPGLNVGGVERHVVDLTSEQIRAGHDVTVISHGGRMVSELPSRVEHVCLPVHRKDPLTGGICALRLAWKARSQGWQVLHAHSRVPAWVAWWASSLSGVPFVVTAHAMYSLNRGLIPYKRAHGAVCVSRTVMEYLTDWLPPTVQVIPHGTPIPGVRWSPRSGDGPVRFLYVGRLTKVKGVDFLVSLFCRNLARDPRWTLEIVGEGPLEGELRSLVTASGQEKRVSFSGYCDDVPEKLAQCDCCLLPSRSEGAGLVLLTALAVGTPVLAADIPAFREIYPDKELIAPTAGAWRRAILDHMEKPSGCFFEPRSDVLPSISQMAHRVQNFYENVCSLRKGGSVR